MVGGNLKEMGWDSLCTQAYMLPSSVTAIIIISIDVCVCVCVIIKKTHSGRGQNLPPPILEGSL